MIPSFMNGRWQNVGIERNVIQKKILHSTFSVLHLKSLTMKININNKRFISTIHKSQRIKDYEKYHFGKCMAHFESKPNQTSRLLIS